MVQTEPKMKPQAGPNTNVENNIPVRQTEREKREQNDQSVKMIAVTAKAQQYCHKSVIKSTFLQSYTFYLLLID